ncbi:MAG: hypothetical protein LBF92_03350 [Synergistaceae bacterium]|nr:hypothetical protein [Synergistaceae bacterium]
MQNKQDMPREKLNKKGSAALTDVELLSTKGVGQETADSILLYAFGFPTFVVDAYTGSPDERNIRCVRSKSLGISRGLETS